MSYADKKAKTGTTEPLPVGQHPGDRHKFREEYVARKIAKKQAAEARRKEKKRRRREAENQPRRRRAYDPRLDEKVRSFGHESYEAYTKSPQWAALRVRIEQLCGSRCLACQHPHTSIHHVSYDNLCEEKDGDCVLLCYRCHSMLHRYVKEGRVALRNIRGCLRLLMHFSEAKFDELLVPFGKAAR